MVARRAENRFHLLKSRDFCYCKLKGKKRCLCDFCVTTWKFFIFGKEKRPPLSPAGPFFTLEQTEPQDGSGAILYRYGAIFKYKRSRHLCRRDPGEDRTAKGQRLNRYPLSFSVQFKNLINARKKIVCRYSVCYNLSGALYAAHQKSRVPFCPYGRGDTRLFFFRSLPLIPLSF